jgi:hypothetical protein
MNRWLIGALGLTLVVPAVGAQVTIDRVLSRVSGEIITQSDVRQARLLKLFGARGDDQASDAAIQRELENRRLILIEVARAALPEPTAERRAARRREWQASLGGSADVPKLLERTGMSDTAMDDWCRNDLRIDAFLAERFKSVPAPDRPREISVWVDELRRRAGLR